MTDHHNKLRNLRIVAWGALVLSGALGFLLAKAMRTQLRLIEAVDILQRLHFTE